MHISGVTWVVMAKKIFFDGEDLHNTQETVKIGKILLKGCVGVTGGLRQFRQTKSVGCLPPLGEGGYKRRRTDSRNSVMTYNGLLS